MKVTIAYAGPEGEGIETIDLLPDASLADAIGRSTLPVRFGLDLAALAFAIHGQRAAPSTALREGDRVELLRALVADPKAARRVRAAEKPLPRRRPAPRKRRSLR